ncbi:MAG TPA: Spy/CpxP family protein refolding chaperone [Cyclobacteriaceae bacterium]|nr:Spy/CpxP family protein refolding chaperone [Cyclobacteriaceae bacterium]
MKKSIVFAGLMMVSTVLLAQQGKKFDRMAMETKRIERMKTELSLTDEQVTKLKAISEKSMKNFEQLRNDSTITVAASRARARKLMTDRKAEVKSVLTPAQQTKWAEYKEKRKAERGHHKDGSGHGRKK